MNEDMGEMVAKATAIAVRAALEVALGMQATALLTLCRTLAEKQLLTPEDIAIFATRTADASSRVLSGDPGPFRAEVIGAVRSYVDELLKLADTGAGTSGRGS